MLICPLQISLDERHLLKGIVQPKMQFYCKCVPSRAILDVDELFVHGHIWRNEVLHHLLSNGCSAVNGCRQNESPNC